MSVRRTGPVSFFILAAIFVLWACPGARAELELLGEKGILVKKESSDWQMNMDGSLRLSFNSLGRVVTLDHDNKNDLQNYMGEQYSAGLGIKFREEYEAYIKFASFGPARYDAPVLPSRAVHTIFGDVGEYSRWELLPRLEEWWVSSPIVPGRTERARAGLFKYSVASGLALGGYYENYGVDVSAVYGDLEARLHFAVPDIENKWYLGPRVHEEKEIFGMKYNSNAWFFAADADWKFAEGSNIQPYFGVLVDRTPASKRSGFYATPVDTEYLGTYGSAFRWEKEAFSLTFETAANFGKAWSIDPRMPDITHGGWMFTAGASYSLLDERVKPRADFYYLSGNKFVGDDITGGQIVKGHNREFSTYSPLNGNLSDSFYQAFEKGPYVFAGMGNSLNNGILRPNSFGDPYVMTNLIAPNLGLDMAITEKLEVSLDYWFLRSAEKAIGADYDPVSGVYSPYTLPSYMGNELDLYAEYKVNRYIVFSLLAGIFFPGDYFRKNRGDGDILGIAAAPRYDGGASNAWMLEAAVTYS
ncbi:MAG: alginate export family protein, partial [Candidatus Omnitrophica bacterium]|nr:alginate export family protein [Candidatus Omnitrophota bacterium]